MLVILFKTCLLLLCVDLEVGYITLCFLGTVCNLANATVKLRYINRDSCVSFIQEVNAFLYKPLLFDVSL